MQRKVVRKNAPAAHSKARAWLVRILFLIAVWFCLRLVDLPLIYFRFQYYKTFGLSLLGEIPWLKLYLAGHPVPLTLFVLKYLLVICALPLCQQFWWLAAALGLFMITSVIPEVLSRTYPLDPIENRQPLTNGPHYDSMKALLTKDGLNLPIMVTDESRRSKGASICLTGRSGREYVLVTDTFVQEYSPQQVTLALGHELGHFRSNGTVLLIHQTSALVVLLATFGLAFVLTGRRPLPVSSAPRIVLVTILCSGSASNALAPASLALSRQEERYADRYALDLGGDREEFKRLLVKVSRHELEPLDMPAWEYYLDASHPTIFGRIAEVGRDL